MKMKLKPVSPCVVVSITLPNILEGENEISFLIHNRAKTSPNSQVHVVEEFIDLCFGLTRKDIEENECSMKLLFDKYPFLQKEEQVLQQWRK